MDGVAETGYLRQLAAAVSAGLVVVVTGSCFAWVTPILLTLLGPDSPVPMTSSQASWMIALPEFGNLFTPIPAGLLADTYGRKPLILSAGPLYLLGWIIIFKAQTVTILCVARVLQGLALGIVFTVVPMYLGEIPSPKFRGTLTSVFHCSFYFGFLFEFCIGPFVSYTTLTAITTALPVLFFICFFHQPETPYFLVMQGKDSEAIKSLMWLRGKTRPAEVHKEMEAMMECVKREMASESSWKDVIATPSDRHALLIVNVVGAVKILSGSVAVPTYCTQLFSNTDFHVIPPHLLTIILGSLVFISCFFSTALTDTVGRRPLLLISSVGCGICLLTVSLYFFLKDSLNCNVQSYNWVCPLALILYCLFLAFGLDPVSITYRAEMHPANTRAIAASINTIIFTLTSLFSLKSYQVVSDSVGVHVVYLGMGLVCLGGTLWMYFIAIETKGKTLSDIQRELHLSAQARRKQQEIMEMDYGVYRTVYV